MSREGDFGNIKMNTPVTKQSEREGEKPESTAAETERRKKKKK